MPRILKALLTSASCWCCTALADDAPELPVTIADAAWGPDVAPSRASLMRKERHRNVMEADLEHPGSFEEAEAAAETRLAKADVALHSVTLEDLEAESDARLEHAWRALGGVDEEASAVGEADLATHAATTASEGLVEESAADEDDEGNPPGWADSHGWYLGDPGLTCFEACRKVNLGCDRGPLIAMALARSPSTDSVNKLNIRGMPKDYCRTISALAEPCTDDACAFPGVFNSSGDCRPYGRTDDQAVLVKCAARPQDPTFRRLCSCKNDTAPELPCDHALVGETTNKTIPDEAISASSYWSNTGAGNNGLGQMWRSRLNNAQSTWSSDVLDEYQWIQWNLGKLMRVNKIVTKGDEKRNNWVTGYRLSFSEDEGLQTWEWHPGIFVGNMDAAEPSESELDPPVIARAIRLHPVAWEGHISLRAELFGCPTTPQPSGKWKLCASEGNQCKCEGIVWYGARRRSATCLGKMIGSHCDGIWQENLDAAYHYRESEEELVCNLTTFRGQDPVPGLDKSCGCDVSSDWTSEHCTTRRRGATTIEFTTPGAVSRRRWCGYGPRDCVWNSWGNFTSCGQDRQGRRYKMRKRIKLLAERNGGKCEGHVYQREPCSAPDIVVYDDCHDDCTKTRVVERKIPPDPPKPPA